MNISMDKKYTLNGKPYFILTTKKPGKYPVVGYDEDGEAMLFNLDGSNSSFYAKNQLLEVSPYDDFVIDEKVMVRDSNLAGWERAYFAGSGDGTALTWSYGATKWSSDDDRSCWNQCRRPTAEELAE